MTVLGDYRVTKSSAIRTVQKVKSEWESTVDSVAELIFIVRKDGVILRANRTIEQWGLGDVENVKGRSLHELLHPSCNAKKCDLKKLLGLSDKVLATGETLEYRGFDLLLNRNLLIQLIPISVDEIHTSGHMAIIFRDISQLNLSGSHLTSKSNWTSLKANNVGSSADPNNSASLDAERQSLASPELNFKFIEKIKREWESAVDSLPQIICLVNGAGTVVRVNRAIEHWKLGDVTLASGRNLHEILHKSCKDKDCYLNSLNQQIASVLAKGQVAECQKQDVVLNKHLHFQINAFSSKHSPQSGLAVVNITDITDIRHVELEIGCLNTKLEKRIKSRNLNLQKINLKLKQEIELRKQAEAKFKDSRQKFTHLVEMMNEGMVIQDLDQKISYANRHLLKILGLPRTEVVGRKFTDFVDVDYIDSWVSGGLKNSKSVESSYVFKMKGKAGKALWVKGAPQPLLDADKNCVGSYAVITDINDQIEIEQKLLITEIKLRSLAKQVLFAQELERKRIASELHDGIGQTLSAIKFYVENNIRDLTETPALSASEQFASVIPKLQGAIEEVRRISMDLRPSLLDDIGVLATLSWFCREAKQASPHVDFSFDKTNVNELDIIASLKTEIFRIVQEAVNNATKYSRAKHINISVKDANKSIHLEVSDDGIGFDYTKVASQQGYSESKGMGLVSMRERVENSGGEFSVSSAPNAGTKVICIWPKEKRAFIDNRSGRRDRRGR